jgi:hypothetical protein
MWTLEPTFVSRKEMLSSHDFFIFFFNKKRLTTIDTRRWWDPSSCAYFNVISGQVVWWRWYGSDQDFLELFV